MGKLKTGLILLLTLALLTAGACLPRIAAAVQDGRTMGAPATQQVRSVQLEIRTDPPALEKLAMFSKQDGVIEIPEGSAALSTAEAEELAYQALELYIEAGLIKPFETYTYDIRPLLAQVPDDPELTGVYWNVSIAEEMEGYCMATLAIDDETGKVLLIHFFSGDENEKEDRKEMLALLGALYFESLGITNYVDFAVDDLEMAYIGENSVGQRYRFGDVVYGEVNLDLYVCANGFYVEFPRL